MDLEAELVSDNTGWAQAILEAGRNTAAATKLEDGGVYVFATPNGIQAVDRDLDEFRATPRRKTGTVYVFDADSFLTYYNKHAIDGSSEVWADSEAFKVTGVLNGPSATEPGWGDFEVVYKARKTPGWLAWEDRDRQIGNQVAFAEHVEDRLVDFVNPDGATMLELAQSFEATSKVDFASSHRLASGQRQLGYTETTEARAGNKGSITIPDTFEIALIPFEGSDPYKVTARLRYRINEGKLAIGYCLERPADVLASAFRDVVTTVQAGATEQILYGTP